MRLEKNKNNKIVFVDTNGSSTPFKQNNSVKPMSQRNKSVSREVVKDINKAPVKAKKSSFLKGRLHFGNHFNGRFGKFVTAHSLGELFVMFIFIFALLGYFYPNVISTEPGGITNYLNNFSKSCRNLNNFVDYLFGYFNTIARTFIDMSDNGNVVVAVLGAGIQALYMLVGIVIGFALSVISLVFSVFGIPTFELSESFFSNVLTMPDWGGFNSNDPIWQSDWACALPDWLYHLLFGDLPRLCH